MYEFEGLLFSSPSDLALVLDDSRLEEELTSIRSGFATPEWINDHAHSAPSKRIEKLFSAYDKPTHPTLAASSIGLDKIRKECPLFNAWMNQLEELEP